jgi:hypothetical protein
MWASGKGLKRQMAQQMRDGSFEPEPGRYRAPAQTAE